MSLTRWKPFETLNTLQNRINRVFDDEYSSNADKSQSTETMNTWFPVTDVYETKDEYVFKMEVPGLTKDDIEIEFLNNTLSVKGERKQEKEVKKEDCFRIERYYGSFNRSFSIPNDVDNGKISAKMNNGILELKVPKAEEKKARSIPIDLK
jgi:HSP20 family protein